MNVHQALRLARRALHEIAENKDGHIKIRVVRHAQRILKETANVEGQEDVAMLLKPYSIPPEPMT